MKKLATLVRTLNGLGHNPATSGNYSIRSADHPELAFVSESAVDKSQFTENNFLPLMINSRKFHQDFESTQRKSSDETDIHLSIYQVTDAKCVLHSHIIDALLFADLFLGKSVATVTGLELLKGFKGVKTHETVINIPCFDNTQDIKTLAELIKPALVAEENNYGLLIRGHGLYVWGESIEGAKRHLEVLEYIFKYYLHSAMRRS